MKTFLHNCEQLLIAFDQMINVLFCLIIGHKGFADESISAHAFRTAVTHGRKWPMRIIDALFFWQGEGHCRRAFESEVIRSHLPPAERENLGEDDGCRT